jgi:hypothetical protein
MERPTQYVRDSFWRGREFTSLEQMQAASVVWSREVAGARKSRVLDGQQPGSVCSTVVRHALLPLPRNEFQLAVWSTGKVATDCHVKVGQALYSALWRLIGQQVHARTCGDVVQIVHNGDVVATHVTHPWGRATDFEHYPPEKIAFTLRNPTWCRRAAAEVGPACTEVISEFMAVNAIHRLRSAQGCWRSAKPSAMRVWKRHVPARSRSATPPTAPSKASSPPATRPLTAAPSSPLMVCPYLCVVRPPIAAGDVLLATTAEVSRASRPISSPHAATATLIFVARIELEIIFVARIELEIEHLRLSPRRRQFAPDRMFQVASRGLTPLRSMPCATSGCASR